MCSNPPFPELVRISEEGRPEIYTDDLKTAMTHDAWERTKPCEHKHFTLLHHYVGNVTRVADLWEQVTRLAESHDSVFPIILEKTLYSGTHCGDQLELDDIKALKDEIKKLIAISKNETGVDLERINMFNQQFSELLEIALEYEKPIVF
ncbi:MAG TPA: hypothetical protein VGQ55_00990 [Pyrinomonadaceae bacterium]|nr:hypothetical protein [Pyrinomonadaceae bacterium]